MLVFGIMIVPIAISGYLLLQIKLGNDSKTWPSVKGELEKFDLRKWTASSKFPYVQGEEERCVVAVKYTYEVDGKVYANRRINFGIDKYYLSPHGYYRSPEDVENDGLTRQLKGDKFEVHYLPALPTVAVLMPGVINLKRHYATIAVLMGTGILLAFGYTIGAK